MSIMIWMEIDYLIIIMEVWILIGIIIPLEISFLNKLRTMEELW